MYKLLVINSIASDKNGNIYVQSRFKDGLDVFDANGKWINIINLTTKYSWCIKIYKNMLYFGSTDGSIQVYDILSQEVINIIKPLWKLGNEKDNYDGRYTMPTGFCIFDDEIFVVDTLEHSILCMTLDGKLKYQKYIRDYIESDPRPVRIDVNENYILISFSANNSVALLSRDFSVIFHRGKKGSCEGEFEIPWDVCLSDDYIYVSDLYNHRVQLFDYKMNFVRSYGEWGRTLGKFNYIYSFEVNRDYVLFADSWNHGFQIWDKTDEGLLPRLKISETDVNQVLRPSRINIINDSIVVTDYLNHSFKYFDTELKQCNRVIGGLGFDIGEYRYPTGIDMFNNMIFTTDIRSGRVTKIESDGTCSEFIKEHIGAPMSPDSDSFIKFDKTNTGKAPTVLLATDISIDDAGNVYIADIGHKAILKFSKDGVFIGMIGSESITVDNKTSFIGCAIYEDRLYITNPGGSSIHIYELEGVLVKTIKPIVDEMPLRCPTGISINNSFIAIADRLNHRVVLLSQNNETATSIGKLGNQEREFCAPWDVALLNDTLYVADSLNNRIQKINIENIYL